jgi:hypothetical protein
LLCFGQSKASFWWNPDLQNQKKEVTMDLDSKTCPEPVPEHQHYHCCESLKALACAVSCIHNQSCCCEEKSQSSKAMNLVLDAMEIHIKSMRNAC